MIRKATNLRAFGKIVSRLKYLSLAGSIVAMSPACAEPDQLTVVLKPAPGVEASLRWDDERLTFILHGLDASPEPIIMPGGNEENFKNPRVMIEDFDFDGYPDFAVSEPVGMVNENSSLYLYRPVRKTYELVTLPADIVARMQCSGMAMLAANVATEAVNSSCRSGPMWYYDELRFDFANAATNTGAATGSDQILPWLYKQSRLTEITGLSQQADQFPFIEVTFDRAGNIIKRVPVDIDGEPTGWTTTEERVHLYAAPQPSARTRAYLIRGDEAEILDIKNGWLHIRYHSRKGALDRWVPLVSADAR